MTKLRTTLRAGGLTAVLVASMGLAVAAPPDARSLGNDLKKGVGAQDAEQVQKALEGLLALGGEDAVEAVLKMVAATSKRGGETIYWQLIGGAAGFQDRQALVTLGEFLAKKGKKAPFGRDLLFGLENNVSPYVTDALAPVLEGGPYDMQLMAADQLAMVRTVASVDLLIGALEREGDDGDPELRRRIMASLSTITKQDMGDALNWIGWWKANRAQGVPEPEATPRGGQFASSTMNKDRGERLESVQRGPSRIVVLSSRLPDDHPKEPGRDYDLDHMEQVLTGMKIPHTVVLKHDFEEDPQKYLADAWTVLVNCNYIQTQCICKTCRKILAEKKAKGQSIGPKQNRLFGCPPECSTHDRVTYRLGQKAIDALKAWVEQGGYLFTEDWGLIEITEVAWPDMVTSQQLAKKGGNQRGGDIQANLVSAMTVPIVPGRGMTSQPILRGVFTRPRPPAREPAGDDDGGSRVREDPPVNPAAPPSHQWMIDDESPSIEVKGRDVLVLMRSEELGKATGGPDAVAVTFRAGRGTPRSQERGADRPTTGGGSLTGKSRGKGAWSEALQGGRVLHVMSHFGKQQASRDDTFVLQNLILNFIMESNEQHQ